MNLWFDTVLMSDQMKTKIVTGTFLTNLYIPIQHIHALPPQKKTKHAIINNYIRYSTSNPLSKNRALLWGHDHCESPKDHQLTNQFI